MDDRRHREVEKSLQPNSRAAQVLLDIGRCIEDAHFGLSRSGLVVRFGVDGARDFLNRKEINLRKQELRRLAHRGIIIRNKIADKYWTAFSERGFEEYLMQLSLQADNLPKGQVCLFSFDVPEDQRRLRNYIRRLLKRIGFKQVHKSVWFCRKNVGDFIAKLFVSKFKGDNWFKVYIASEL